MRRYSLHFISKDFKNCEMNYVELLGNTSSSDSLTIGRDNSTTVYGAFSTNWMPYSFASRLP